MLISEIFWVEVKRKKHLFQVSLKKKCQYLPFLCPSFDIISTPCYLFPQKLLMYDWIETHLLWWDNLLIFTSNKFFTDFLLVKLLVH